MVTQVEMMLTIATKIYYVQPCNDHKLPVHVSFACYRLSNLLMVKLLRLGNLNDESELTVSI